MRATAAAMDAVHTQWDRLEDQAFAEEMIAIQILVAKAREDDVLGQLYPFISVSRLCFSRCIDYPYYVDVLISPLDPTLEKYALETTVGGGGWADTARLREVSGAGEAIRFLKALLPSDYGPALIGNADQWREEFNKKASGFRTTVPASNMDEH